MRLCVISARFYPQIVGSGTSAYLVARELVRRGHEVTIITDGAIRESLGSENVPFDLHFVDSLEDYAIGLASFQETAKEIFDIISNNNFDALHVHNFMPMLLVSLIRPLLRQPIVFTFHNTPSNSGRAIGYFDIPELDIQLARSVIAQKQYDRLLLGSKRYLDFAMYLGADPRITEFAYLGIDHKVFQNNLNDADHVDLGQYFAKGQLSGGDKIILLPGRITPRKGILEAIRALALLDDHSAKLILTGMALPFDGEFAKVARAEAMKLDVASRVISPREVIPSAHLPAMYRRAEIVITPSYYEGLGLTTIEALAAGKPLVATNVPGIDEIATHNINALIVSPHDPVGLAKAISKFLKDERLAKKLASRGPDGVRKFDSRKHAERVEQLFSEIHEDGLWKHS